MLQYEEEWNVEMLRLQIYKAFVKFNRLIIVFDLKKIRKPYLEIKDNKFSVWWNMKSCLT